MKFTKKTKLSSGTSEDIVEEENVAEDIENIQDNVNAEDYMENVYAAQDVVDYNQPYGPDCVQKRVLPPTCTDSLAVLNFIKELNGCYPNVWIAYRILLTVPVTVASAERSFSKLKLIKNYLRSTMSQSRLNGLAMLSIERDLIESLDYESLMDEFASRNACRSIFKK